MKIGVRAHDFGRMKPEALAKTISLAGFETVQLAVTKAINGVHAFSDISPVLLERISQAFAIQQVEIGVLGCYVEIGELDRETRLREVEKFLMGLEHAQRLGVHLVGTETTRFLTNPDNTNHRETAYQGLKDSVLRMAERAEKLDVNIGIETVADHTLNTAELTRRLLDEVNSNKLRVIFDPVNLLLTAQDMQSQESIYQNFLDLVGLDIAAFHIKDIELINGEKVWRNIGAGAVNYETIFKWFRNHPISIPVLREHSKPESCQTDIKAIKALCKGKC